MKNGFSLIAAVFFIILVATTALTALSIATMTARDTSTIYGKEQALLLAQSATEFTVMAMQAHVYPRQITGGGYDSANCLERVRLTYPNSEEPWFIMNVNIYYLDNLTNCGTNIGRTRLLNAGGTPQTTPTTHAALVDVTVRSTPAFSTVPIVYNRRTLQKP
ncbi:MAG: hypothetical protein KH703_08815 [Campylobacter gracilis]|uniref:hypothetical protein n=1 Tax=Campylobacter gracilis TaxID=824 RepID=UPI0026ECC523|nr:hypothetical protein [Campylobacter gracilis]MBS6153472.1 hypothetical protein [Campylobacter gracilis]